MDPTTGRQRAARSQPVHQLRWDTRREPVDRVHELESSLLPFPQTPMLAQSVDSLPDVGELPGGAAYEPKFDGYRAIVFVQSGGCRIQSRHGRDITRSFPDIAAAAIENLPSGVVIDGELVVWGDESSDFAELARRLKGDVDLADTQARPASFIAFDVLAGAGMDMRRSPFRVRRQALTILLGDAPAPLHVVPQTRHLDEAQHWMANYSEAQVGIEGVVAKGLSTSYTPGERGWSKMRIRESVECVVGAVTGTLRNPGRLILGTTDSDGELRVVGCTTAMTLPQSRRLGALLAPVADSHPWSSAMPLRDVPGWHDESGPDAQLVRPTTVVEVSTDLTVADVWAEPRELIRLRPELLAAEIGSV